MADAQPTISDGVVTLSTFSLRDAGALVDANRDPEMAKRFDFPPGEPSREAARSAIRRWREGWRRRRVVAFAVRDAASGAFIGGCEVRIGKDGIANLSYFTIPARRSEGVATRAAKLAAGFAFSELHVERLEIRVETDNVASRAVAKGAGFQFEGTLRSAGVYRRGRRDMALYARVRAADGD